jgi:hypothetical protein
MTVTDMQFTRFLPITYLLSPLLFARNGACKRGALLQEGFHPPPAQQIDGNAKPK